MNYLAKAAIAACIVGATSLGAAAPASADVGISFGFGEPGFYRDYDYNRPCSFYRYWNLPAPARCYRDFYGYYGQDVFIDGDFVFRDRDDFGRWRDRDDFRRWRDHDFRRDTSFHGAWHGDAWRGRDDHGGGERHFDSDRGGHGGWSHDSGRGHGDHGGWDRGHDHRH